MAVRMANYDAIEMGENDALIHEQQRKQLIRNLAIYWSVFSISAVLIFCITVEYLFMHATPLLKPTAGFVAPLLKSKATPLLTNAAQWSNCASFSLAECCDCGEQNLVAGQCWDGNLFKGMSTCKRGCCLAGLVDTCNPKDMMITAAFMAAVCAGTVGLFFLAFGLGPLGPIAGGMFAGLQGAGFAAGSLLAILQSAAMTGAGVGFGAAFGAVIGALAACFHCTFIQGAWQCAYDFERHG